MKNVAIIYGVIAFMVFVWVYSVDRHQAFVKNVKSSLIVALSWPIIVILTLLR